MQSCGRAGRRCQVVSVGVLVSWWIGVLVWGAGLPGKAQEVLHKAVCAAVALEPEDWYLREQGVAPNVGPGT